MQAPILAVASQELSESEEKALAVLALGKALGKER